MLQHALVIGIDAYRNAPPLRGCANDADAVEAFLLQRLQLDPLRLRKLVSRVGLPQPTDRPATLASMREELERLGSDLVTPEDRVLVWYSGHGLQIQGRAGHEGREALVPVDFGPDTPLLWDVELNRLLHAIAARTPHLTVILDSCSSAGAFRALGQGRRTFVAEGALALPEPSASRGLLRLLSTGSFAVIAAAQADQEAQELLFGDKHHGLLTRVLLDVLDAHPPAELASLAWGRIWQRVLAGVAERNPRQDPVLVGRLERPLFGGPAVPRDLGFLVRATPEGWQVEAGTLAGVAQGARIAVYPPEEPAHFPLLDSEQDRRARLGTLRIVSATLSTAVGEAEVPFLAPEGARARVVTPGAADRLRVQTDDAEALALLRTLPWVELCEEGAEIEIGRDRQGLWVGDGWFGPGSLGPLVRVDSSRQLLAALDHARTFVAPLRLAARARALPGALELSLRDGASLEGGGALLRDAAGPQTWRLPEGTPFVLEIANTSRQDLYVSVLNCASSGRVELLADALQLPAGHRQIVWAAEQVGQPFVAFNRPERPVGLERIVLVGTTASDRSLRSFEEVDTFAEVVERGGVERELLPAQPTEQWTARIFTLRIERGGQPLPFVQDPQDEALPEVQPYERDEADPDVPASAPGGGRGRTLPFAFDDRWLIPIEPGQAVGRGWLSRWGFRPLGVTWHWGATTSLMSLSATLGGAEALRKGQASAHYGVGRSYADGVHRYVRVSDRSWHAGKHQVTRWDGRKLTEADEKATRTTIGVETDHRGHVPASQRAPADWMIVADSLGELIKVQPWAEEQLEMLIEVGKEIQAAWPHLGPRDHHGHSDLCPGYKTDVAGFPFARVLRGIYDDPSLPDVWSPFRTLQGRQRALQLLGYDLGPAGVDGIWGERSRAALRQFKLDAGLTPEEREGDPVGGHWTTFVGWALFDRFQAQGLAWSSLLS